MGASTEDKYLLLEQRVASSFRYLDEAHHPLLAQMTRDQVYDNGAVMAPGGLYLAKVMTDHLDIFPGAKILDLGCGRGQTTAFLADHFEADVVGVDYWMKHDERVPSKSSTVRHIQADVRRGLPFGAETFDFVFSMQAFHTFATSKPIMRYLSSLLKLGGKLCIAQTCFDVEPDPLPEIYSDTGGFHAGYNTYHSPNWWLNHVSDDGTLSVDHCHELPDGRVYWEDHFLYECNRHQWAEDRINSWSWLMEQILFSQSHSPALTHFLLRATRRRADASIEKR